MGARESQEVEVTEVRKERRSPWKPHGFAKWLIEVGPRSPAEAGTLGPSSVSAGTQLLLPVALGFHTQHRGLGSRLGRGLELLELR